MQEITLKSPINIGDTIEYEGLKLVARYGYFGLPIQLLLSKVDQKYWAYNTNVSHNIKIYGFVPLDELKQ